MKPTRSRLEAVRRMAELPVDGKLLNLQDLMEDLGLSRRSVEILIETGRLAAVKDSKRWISTSAARNEYVHSLIAEDLAELEGLTE